MKRVVVTGSIATDHPMTFPARFADRFIADNLSQASLSFLEHALPSISVNAIAPTAVVDPTFRYGVACRLPVERAAQRGCLIATAVLEPQEYRLDHSQQSNRAAVAYGDQAAGEIESVLRIGS